MSKDDLKENQIKEVAKKLFQEKGFERTRTREIAEAAGVNSALLHYYFRNKETLFHIVMQESLYELFSFLKSIVNDHSYLRVNDLHLRCTRKRARHHGNSIGIAAETIRNYVCQSRTLPCCILSGRDTGTILAYFVLNVPVAGSISLILLLSLIYTF